jgi:hypothetical protein
MIKVKQPVYYWCSYWQKWDEILGYNPETNYIVVQEVGTDKIREHCTIIEKDNLSTVLINREDYFPHTKIHFDGFKNQLKNESGKAWAILRDSGIPRRFFKFD